MPPWAEAWAGIGKRKNRSQNTALKRFFPGFKIIFLSKSESGRSLAL
jgi:hypothetical protein